MPPLEAAVAVAHQPQQRRQLTAAQRVHDLAPQQRHAARRRLHRLERRRRRERRAAAAQRVEWHQRHAQRRRRARVRRNRRHLRRPLAQRRAQRGAHRVAPRQQHRRQRRRARRARRAAPLVAPQRRRRRQQRLWRRRGRHWRRGRQVVVGLRRRVRLGICSSGGACGRPVAWLRGGGGVGVGVGVGGRRVGGLRRGRPRRERQRREGVDGEAAARRDAQRGGGGVQRAGERGDAVGLVLQHGLHEGVRARQRLRDAHARPRDRVELDAFRGALRLARQSRRRRRRRRRRWVGARRGELNAGRARLRHRGAVVGAALERNLEEER